MQRTILLLAIVMLSNLAFAVALAHAGGHHHSHNHSNNTNNNFKVNNPPIVQSNQIVSGFKVATNNKLNLGNMPQTGNRNGMGFIADPARRSMTTNLQPNNGNFIADPLRIKTNNVGTPIIREHGDNPNVVVSPPRPRYDSIQGGGLGLDLNPFDFQAPINFDNQPRDHRTITTGFPGSGQSDPKKGHNVWTPNTSGPANRTPVKP